MERRKRGEKERGGRERGKKRMEAENGEEEEREEGEEMKGRSEEYARISQRGDHVISALGRFTMQCYGMCRVPPVLDYPVVKACCARHVLSRKKLRPPHSKCSGSVHQ